MRFTRQTFIVILLAVTLFCTLRLTGYNAASAQGGSAMHPFQELIEQSQKEKKGLTFFIKGQNVGGVVTKIISPETVEVRNQTFSRIIIRLDQVDAVAIN